MQKRQILILLAILFPFWVSAQILEVEGGARIETTNDNTKDSVLVTDGNGVIYNRDLSTMGDADADPTNEKISSFMIVGDSLSITEGDIILKVGVDISNTNEIQTLSLAGNSLSISSPGGNSVTLPWTKNGTDIYSPDGINVGIGTTDPLRTFQIGTANAAVDVSQNTFSIGTLGADQWQSFVPTIDGIVTGVFVRTNDGSQVGVKSTTISLYDGTGTMGTLISTNLTDIDYPINNDVYLPFLGPVAVTSGQSYTFRIQEPTNELHTLASNSNPYPDGHYYSNSYGEQADWDWRFQVQIFPVSSILAFDVSTGSLGIGTITPDQELSVNGGASKIGGGAWSTFSDFRVKKEIENFTDGLDIVQQISPVTFKYNGKGGYPNNGKEYIGVIAQDIESVAPYMIEHVTRKLEPADEECVALRMYDPSALVYILVNAVKEQQQQINLLKDEYSIVKDLLKDRKSHSEALESRIQLLEQKVVDNKSSTANLSIEAPVEID